QVPDVGARLSSDPCLLDWRRLAGNRGLAPHRGCRRAGPPRRDRRGWSRRCDPRRRARLRRRLRRDDGCPAHRGLLLVARGGLRGRGALMLTIDLKRSPKLYTVTAPAGAELIGVVERDNGEAGALARIS